MHKTAKRGRKTKVGRKIVRKIPDGRMMKREKTN